MRFLLPLILVATSGCGVSAPSSTATGPAQGSADQRIAEADRIAKEAQAVANQAIAERDAAEARAVREKTALASKIYWDRCCDINKQFITDKSEIWFRSFRPETVGATCAEAATRLRSLETAVVDPEVIDHVNRVIRGFETIGSVVKVKGRESLERDAGDAVKFIYRSSRRLPAGAYGVAADGGMIPIGVGWFSGGRQSGAEGQEQTTKIAAGLINSEEVVIKHMRENTGSSSVPGDALSQSKVGRLAQSQPFDGPGISLVPDHDLILVHFAATGDEVD